MVTIRTSNEPTRTLRIQARTYGKTAERNPNAIKSALPPFAQLVERTRTATRPDPPESLLALDPGGTTGWAFFTSTELVAFGQIPDYSAEAVRSLLVVYKPAHIVMENYVIYTNKLQAHQHSDVPTLQLIGAIKYLADSIAVPYTLQTAVQVKSLANDTKLKAWNLYQKGSPHATDAIRHAVYYLLAGRLRK